MNSRHRTIAVMGATGRQGGAAVSHLLAAGWHVRAVTRRPGSPAGLALGKAGAEVIAADMADRGSLGAAFKGAHGVFSIQPASVSIAAETQIEHGRAVADIAAEAGARHLVYTSVSGVDQHTGVSDWEAKWVIDQHIRGLGIPATLLRPVSFMENFLDSAQTIAADGTVANLAAPDQSRQFIAVDDIGAFAALAFGDPASYLGTTLELAGDELTYREAAAKIGRALARQVTYRQLPPGALIQALGEKFADDVHHVIAYHRTPHGERPADIRALRARHPGLMSFDAWLRRTGQAGLEARLAAGQTA